MLSLSASATEDDDDGGAFYVDEYASVFEDTPTATAATPPSHLAFNVGEKWFGAMANHKPWDRSPSRTFLRNFP
jgi:hypothetical protein